MVAVSVLPPANADQLTPGVFVLTVKLPDETAPRIETAKSFLLHETLDADGHEAGASVPSTTWSLLDPPYREQLAGMKLGEIRRFWTCSDRARERCKVEDVEVLSVESNGGQQQVPKPLDAGGDDPRPDVTEPMPVGGEVTAPVTLKRVEPEWPKQVTKQRTWLYSLVVTKTGSVKDLRLVRGDRGVYSTLIEEALVQWEFKPGTYRGQPVDVRYNMTITVHVR